jgi:hypothetical protein
MQGPTGTAQTRRPKPLVTAARAPSPCGKGVPNGAAPVKKFFRIRAIIAIPTAQRIRLPFAVGATDAANFLFFLSLGVCRSRVIEP